MRVVAGRMHAWLYTAFLLVPFAAMAAGEGGTLGQGLSSSADQRLRSFKDILDQGGWTMDVIVALSALSTCFVIFYLFTIRAGVLYPKVFVQEAEDAADEGDIEALTAICQDSDSAAAKIIGAAAEQMAGEKRADYMVVRDAIEDEGARQAGILWQRIQYLQDVAVISPMVGLLGTVLGMLESFASLEVEVGAVIPTQLAEGVAKALITTAGGLVVGIAAMVLYAYFRGRVSNLTAGLESACSRVLRRLTTQRMGGQFS